MTGAIASARSTWGRLGPEGRFPVRLLVVLVALTPVAVWLLDPLVRSLIHATVAGVRVVADGLGLAPVVGEEGAMGFAHGAFGYQIVDACTIAVPGVVYAAAVLAFPAPLRHRALGLALGLPVLFVLNLARLVGLAYVGVEHRRSYETLHWFGFQVLLIVATAAVFLAWVAWSRGVRAQRPARTPRGGLGSVGLFLVTFAPLLALGFNDAVVDLYARFVGALYWPVGSRLWPGLDYSHYEFFPWRYALMFYVTLAGIVALVVATRSRSPRGRVVLALEMVPIVAALAALDLVLKVGVDLSELRGGFWAGRSVGVEQAFWVTRRILLGGVPLWMWWQWASSPVRSAGARVSDQGQRQEALH